MYKKNCLQCGNKKLIKFLDLGNQPWCNDFKNNYKLSKKTKKYPLKLYYCNNCYGAQLNFFVNKETMFLDHDYLSGINPELIEHFKRVSKKVRKKYISTSFDKKNILDIGSNDGTFLSFFTKDWNVLGIDSCNKALAIAKKKRIKTLKQFFNYDSIKFIKTEFDVIHASGIFFHLEDLISFTKGVKHLLKTKGTFIIQFLYLKDILEKNRFDQIYHEHLIYYNLRSLSLFLDRYDLEIYDSEHSNVHGGSVIAYVGHKGFNKQTVRHIRNLVREKKFFQKKYFYLINNFQGKVNKIAQNLQKKIKRYIEKKYNIIGIGAAAKSSVILNFANLNDSHIKQVLETNNLKINKFIPGTGIKIINENKISNRIFNEKKVIFLIFIWNFKKNIVQKLKKRFPKVSYFFPY